MRTVHRLSPLPEEGWRLNNAAKPSVAPAAAPKGLQPAPCVRGDPCDATPLLFALEDIPSPLQRPQSAAGTAPGAPGASNWEAAVGTLQLLLGPASDAEEMLHTHIQLAQELAGSRGQQPAGTGAAGSGAAQFEHATSRGGSEPSGPDTPPAEHDGTGGAHSPPDAHALAAIFQRLGYAPKVKSSTLKIAQRKGLQHYYLTVHLPDGTPEGGGIFILDPAFKEAFVVSNPTPRYAAVLGSLDHHAAATKGCLRQAVVLLCSELAQCFAERGLPIPPWRTPAALLARWNL